jgi:hypothetical protein
MVSRQRRTVAPFPIVSLFRSGEFNLPVSLFVFPPEVNRLTSLGIATGSVNYGERGTDGHHRWDPRWLLFGQAANCPSSTDQ